MTKTNNMGMKHKSLSSRESLNRLNGQTNGQNSEDDFVTYDHIHQN